MRKYFAPILAGSLILQGSLLSFPLCFVFLTNFAIKEKNLQVFPLAFFLGLILDAFYIKTLGTTSLFFLVFLFALFSYSRKFEIDHASFIFVSSFLGGMGLFLLAGDSGIILKSFLVSVFSVLISKLY